MGELSPSQRIVGLRGAYVVERELGEGGFGVAFLARDEAGRRVVLKQLQLARMGDWKAMELFAREARVLASLAHPGVPRCHDFFALADGRPFAPDDLTQLPSAAGAALVLVQDFIEGDTLQARIDAGQRMTADAAEALLRALLGVLGYLHRLHPPVIHRDIKPANILITPAGAPVLVDFGASQDRQRRESELGSTSVGTFGYFPIEQLLGKARPASDLYALAMTMVVALTHRQPEDLPLDPATSKVLVDKAAPGLPPRLAEALARMLEPAVGARVASAEDALRLLDGVALAPATPVAPARQARTLPALVHQVPLYGGTVAALAFYGVLFDSFSESDLVAMSYLWVPVIAFGLGVRLRGTIVGGLTWALFGFLLLGVFLVGIFPAL